MSKGKGISRITIELVLLLIEISLALIIISPISSHIPLAVERLHKVGGVTTIEVMAIIDLETDRPAVYVRKLGALHQGPF